MSKKTTPSELAEALAQALAEKIVNKRSRLLQTFMVANAAEIARCIRRCAELERERSQYVSEKP